MVNTSDGVALGASSAVSETPAVTGPGGVRGRHAERHTLEVDLVRAVTPDPDLAQRCFRAVLDALACPGTPARLPDSPAPAVLRPVLTLADLDTPVCVLGCAQWAGALATATAAPIVGLGGARLVAALRAITPEELATVRRGTPSAPESAALVAMAVPSLTGGPPLRLRGPGVRGHARGEDDTLVIAPRGFGLVAARVAILGFPVGPDLLLVDPHGAVVGLPRTTMIEEI